MFVVSTVVVEPFTVSVPSTIKLLNVTLLVVATAWPVDVTKVPMERWLVVPNTAIDVAADDENGVLISDTYLQTVIAHEVGHALGIAGHSNDAGDLMYTSGNSSGYPTTEDRNTIKTAYASHFGGSYIDNWLFNIPDYVMSGPEGFVEGSIQ